MAHFVTWVKRLSATAVALAVVLAFSLGGATTAQASGTSVFLVNTSATSWVVPSDWNSSNNTIQCIAAGGSGAAGSSSRPGGGGGGGGYAEQLNQSLRPGST